MFRIICLQIHVLTISFFLVAHHNWSKEVRSLQECPVFRAYRLHKKRASSGSFWYAGRIVKTAETSVFVRRSPASIARPPPRPTWWHIL